MSNYQHKKAMLLNIATVSQLAETTARPVYEWLADKQANGELNLPFSGDFQKVLISEEGELVAVFSPKLSPLDHSIIDAIRMDY